MNASSLLFISLAALGVASCDAKKRETSPSADSSPAIDTMAVAPAWAVPPRFTNLTCTPAVIRPGDVLSMRMTLPHGPTFMAIGPDGTPYVVVFHGEGSADRTRRKSLMPPDAFSKVTELNLDPRTLMAGVSVSGRDTNEVVFQTPGIYRLKVGSNMETDGPIYAECLVRYAP